MMKNAVKYPLQIVTAIFALTVFFFALSIPVCAEESSEPAEATQGEMDEAYDEAMMQSDSEVTFYTMEEANYQLAVICKFVSGKLTDDDYDEMNNPDAVHILSMDGIHMLAPRLKDVEDDAFVTLVHDLFQHVAETSFFFFFCCFFY